MQICKRADPGVWQVAELAVAVAWKSVQGVHFRIITGTAFWRPPTLVSVRRIANACLLCPQSMAAVKQTQEVPSYNARLIDC